MTNISAYNIWSIILLLLFSSSVYAYDAKIDGIYYNLKSDATAEVTYGEINQNSYSGDIIIPEKITVNKIDYSVQTIGVFAFRWCPDLISVKIPSSVTIIEQQTFCNDTKLETVIIPENVKTIGSGAFEGCTAFTSLFIPSKVQDIGSRAFFGCSGLTSISVDENNPYFDSRNNCNAIIRKADMTLVKGCNYSVIPNGVKTIGTYAFTSCTELTDVILPQSLQKIEDSAFYGCVGLKSLVIPYNVSKLAANSFAGCDGLSTIVVESGNTKYDSRNNCNAIIETATNTLFRGCKNTIIPISVTSIGNAAFMACNGLSTITIPNSVNTIGGQSFENCKDLISIDIPQSVTSIGYGAFSLSNNLKSVIVRWNNPITISSLTFSNRWNATLYVPKGSKSAYAAADYWKEFKEIVEYSTTTSYTLSITSSAGGSIAYAGNTISGATNSYSVDEGTSHTLTFTPNSGYRLKSVIVNGTDVTASIKNDQYTISSISQNTTISVTFEENSLNDGDTFTAKTVEGVDMTFKVISAANKTCQVGDGESSESSAINKSISGAVTIPSSINGFTVTGIGSYAFYSCISLTSVTIPNTVTSIENSAFVSCFSLKAVHISDLAAWCNISFPPSDSNPLYYAHHLYLNGSEIKDLVIPSSVKSIGSGAFYGCSGLTSVTIPNNVTSIERDAFGLCSGLTSITIPNSVTSIGQYAFSGCSGLTSITIPNSVTSISGNVFSGCSGLTSISVESGNTKYDSRDNCNAIIETKTSTLIRGCKNTTIPNSVTGIEYSAFSSCSGLTSITIPNSVTFIGDGAFRNCSGLTSVMIPNSVKSIENSAFADCSNLTSVTIPNSVTKIRDYAFRDCSGLTSVTVERATPITIGSDVFTNRTNATLYVPQGSKSAYQAANYWKEFKEIVEYSTTTSYSLSITSSSGGSIAYVGYTISGGTYFFSVDEGTSHTLVFAPNSGYRLKSVMVNGTDVTASVANNQYTISNINQNTTVSVQYEISYSDGETFIANTAEGIEMTFKVISAAEKTCQVGNGASAAINISASGTITIPSSVNGFSVTSIGQDAFYGCTGLTSMTIPNSVTSIGIAAFLGCAGLTSMTIPSSVTYIRNYAFSGCGLTSITIPSSVTTISSLAFYACSGLTSITVSSGNPEYDSRNNCNAIIKKSSNTLIAGCKNTVIPNSVTSIGEDAFYGCTGLTSITIPSSVTSIGGYAFFGCSDLTSIEIPNSVTSIGDKAFSGCSGMTSITIPNSVTSIGQSAFSGCSGLTSVTIPNSVKSIGNSAFSGCSGLTSVTIPSSVKSIGNSAFNSCSGLTSVTIPKSVTSIGEGAFENCIGLTSVKVEWGTPLEIPINTFSGSNSATLYVPIGRKSVYEAAANWKFNNIEEYMYLWDGTEGSTFTAKTIEGVDMTFMVTSVADNACQVGDDTKLAVDNKVSGTITIPSKVDGVSVIRIGKSSFEFCYGLTCLVIPNNVTSIGERAFYGCYNIVDVTLPSTLESIEENAFYGCYGMTSLTVGWKTPISINASTFSERKKTILHVPQGSKAAYQLADYWKEFKEIVEYATNSTCSLSITSSAGGYVAYAGNTISGTTNAYNVNDGTSPTLAFTPNSGYRLKSVVVNGADVTASVVNNQYTINNISQNTTVNVTFERVLKDGDTFSAKTAEDIDMTFMVISVAEKTCQVGTNSYSSPAINEGTSGSITIPNSVNGFTVTSIGQYAFYGFDGLISVTIPSSVTSIGNKAFYGCSNLTSVTVESEFPITIDSYVFSNRANATLYVPKGSKAAYQAANYWQDFKEIVEMTSRTFTLTVTAWGNGYVRYKESAMSFRSQTKEFPVDEGSSATLVFTPGYDCRLKSVIVNGIDVTASVVNNEYTISNISQNTTVSVTFVDNSQTPPTHVLLTISSYDGGFIYYSGECISGGTYTVEEGISATLNLIPESGYRLASLIVNNENVTADVVNNQYTISNISQNTTVSVTFEKISPTTYSLSITSSTGGSVVYEGNSISGATNSYSVDEGTSAKLTFTPNSGYRLSSVMVNGIDVTASVANNQYIISNISQNTTVSVTFEEIPVTPPSNYVLTVYLPKYGYVETALEVVDYDERARYYSMDEGSSQTLTFVAHSGYRLESVRVNGEDVTASVVNNHYTIENVNQDVDVQVMFVADHEQTWTVAGDVPSLGSAWDPTVTANDMSSADGVNFTLVLKNVVLEASEKYTYKVVADHEWGEEYPTGDPAEITVNADGLYTITFTFNKDSKRVSAEVTKIDLAEMAADGVNFTVTSYADRTVNVAAGSYGKVLTVPETVEYEGLTWTVKGIDRDVLADKTDLAAIVWNPDVSFTAEVPNPNLLLYVKSADYAPSAENNVVVNGVAQRITLTEAGSGNDFYCPQAFTARSITYSHSYQMTTGIDKCQGWETIALPFDVQTVSHATKGTVVPFAARTNNGQKAFWLYELTSSGWRAATAIKANTPYIISMPNNDLYYDEARLNGRITFSATDVTVPVTSETPVTYRGRTFVPNFLRQQQRAGVYTLNVNNDWYTSANGTEGSLFVANQRSVSPFEAYMTTTSGARTSFGVFDDTTTEIRGVEELIDAKRVDVYNLNGQKRKTGDGTSMDGLKRTLPAGVYIINGQKVIVR